MTAVSTPKAARATKSVGRLIPGVLDPAKTGVFAFSGCRLRSTPLIDLFVALNAGQPWWGFPCAKASATLLVPTVRAESARNAAKQICRFRRVRDLSAAIIPVANGDTEILASLLPPLTAGSVILALDGESLWGWGWGQVVDSIAALREHVGCAVLSEVADVEEERTTFWAPDPDVTISVTVAGRGYGASIAAGRPPVAFSLVPAKLCKLVLERSRVVSPSRS